MRIRRPGRAARVADRVRGVGRRRLPSRSTWGLDPRILVIGFDKSGKRRARSARQEGARSWARTFFSEVTGPIPFGGLGSDDPLAFKVYEPDRMVLGKRMADHLRIGVCLWHSFAWDGRDMFGVGTLDRPVARSRRRPDARRAPEDGRRVRVHREARACRTTASTTATSPPRADSFAEFRDNLDALTDDALGYQERTGVAAAVGHREPVHASPLPGRRGHQPRSRGVRVRRGPGQAHAGGHPAAGRHELRPVGRSRGLRHAPQHRPPARRATSSRGSSTSSRSTSIGSGSTGTLLIEPKPMEPTKHQYDYDSATIHGFLVRQRARGRVPPEHRGEPRDARRSLVPPRGRLRGRARHPRQHRREPRRPPERLGHRPVPELRRGPRAAALRDPAGRRARHRRLQLRRQAAAPEHRPDRPVPRPHRRHRHARARAPRRRRAGRARDAVEAAGASATRAGPDRSGRRSSMVDETLAVAGGQGRRGRDRPGAALGPPGAARERGQPA